MLTLNSNEQNCSREIFNPCQLAYNTLSDLCVLNGNKTGALVVS